MGFEPMSAWLTTRGICRYAIATPKDSPLSSAPQHPAFAEFAPPETKKPRLSPTGVFYVHRKAQPSVRESCLHHIVTINFYAGELWPTTEHICIYGWLIPVR